MPHHPAPADLYVITAYFNSAGFVTKLANYHLFIESLTRAGVNHLTIECAFANAPFELAPSAAIVRIRARDVMWQKERLLNLALSHLPPTCTKVAWIDCDVLFESADWAQQTSKLLDVFPIVQPFTRVVRLPRDHRAYTGQGDLWHSFATIYKQHPNLMLAGDFARHGHTGFAWAARRDLLQRHGLYDACISGSGDHMMAHAFCGDWASP
ncbi:MAG: hypothetical protein JWN40_1258, partial [Phycisphaerales bacterium]|nr:hypothetical protein [Phycisphaerales bacterium]